MSRPLFAVTYMHDQAVCLENAEPLFSFEEYKEFEDNAMTGPVICTTDYAYYQQLQTYSSSWEIKDEDKDLIFSEDDDDIKAFFDNQSPVLPEEIIDADGKKLEAGMFVKCCDFFYKVLSFEGMLVTLAPIPKRDGQYNKWGFDNEGKYRNLYFPCEAGKPIEDPDRYVTEFCRDLTIIKLHIFTNGRFEKECVIEEKAYPCHTK